MATSIIGIRAMRNDILVDIYDDGSRTTKVGGKTFYIPRDDTFGQDALNRTVHSKHTGIRPRWGMVLSTSDNAEASGLKVGQKVLLDTMKWSRGVTYDLQSRAKFWRIPITDVLLIDDEGFDDDELETLAARYGDMK